MGNEKIEMFKDNIDATIRLISLYEKSGIQIPQTLKGNVGEFLVTIELLKRFPLQDCNYLGGANPKIDITIGNSKIQVKTCFQPKIWESKRAGGKAIAEACPTIKKSTFDKDTCNIIVFVGVYLDKTLSKIKKTNLYVFNKEDFKYFGTIGCWTGKTRGDRSICNLLSVTGAFSPVFQKFIDHYNTPEYKKLFHVSKDAWGKIDFYVE